MSTDNTVNETILIIDSVQLHKINHPTDDLSNYRITEDGKIYSMKHKRFLKNNVINGYEVINIYSKTYSIHRIVAMTFIPTNDYSLNVDHIDDNPFNNHKNNLQWLTQKENINKITKETSHARTVIQKDLNGNVIAEFNSVTEAGEAIGVSRYAISKACLKVNKTCNGFIFDYKDDEHMHNIINTTDGKKVDGYENYIVLKNGTIYNTMRKAYLKPIVNKSGYAYVTLCKNKIKQNMYVQRIVATAYCENPDPETKTQVNHKNKNRSDNRADNLEWVSQTENILHAKNNIDYLDV
jgi:HNH endonuclease